MVGAKVFLMLPSLVWDMDKFIDNGLIDDNFYDEGAGNFTVLSFTGEDAIEFTFLIDDDGVILSGSGYIGGTCGDAPSAVLVSAAAWLFGSALLGLTGLRRKAV